MFTGIIQEMGVVQDVKQKKNLSVLRIKTKKAAAGVKIGDSISINGTCLTVIFKAKTMLSFAVMEETLKRTTLGAIKSKDCVNLEKALRIGDRLDGHFVTGHIDNVGKLLKKVERENYIEFQISTPKEIKPYMVEKGSICIDGVSLTVGQVKTNWFSVYLIPHTAKITTLGLKKEGDLVNLEADLLAKYIQKLPGSPASRASGRLGNMKGN